MYFYPYILSVILGKLSYFIIHFFPLLFHITSSLQPKPSISLSTSHFRKPRHAVASSKRYEDNFGFVSSGINAVEKEDHSLSFHGGRSYTSKKTQGGKAAAPHARNVSILDRFATFRSLQLAISCYSIT